MFGIVMINETKTLNLAGYLTVGDAAMTLGVSKSTLRNWDKEGKLKPYRHPVNGYRLYNRQELDDLLKQIKHIQ